MPPNVKPAPNTVPTIVVDAPPSPRLDSFVQRLQDRLDPHRVDWTGCAPEFEPERLSGVTSTTFVEDVERARASARLDRVLVMGVSFGGCLALAYAAAHPDRVAGAVVWGCAPAFDDPEAPDRFGRRASPAQVSALQRVFSGQLADPDERAAMLREILPVYVADPGSFNVEAVVSALEHPVAVFNHTLVDIVPTFTLVGSLASVRCPVLVIAGRHDWLTPPEQAERLLPDLPNAELAVFEASGHFPHLEEPDRFDTLVRGWLDRTDLALG